MRALRARQVRASRGQHRLRRVRRREGRAECGPRSLRALPARARPGPFWPLLLRGVHRWPLLGRRRIRPVHALPRGQVQRHGGHCRMRGLWRGHVPGRGRGGCVRHLRCWLLRDRGCAGVPTLSPWACRQRERRRRKRLLLRRGSAGHVHRRRELRGDSLPGRDLQRQPGKRRRPMRGPLRCGALLPGPEVRRARSPQAGPLRGLEHSRAAAPCLPRRHVQR